MGIYGVAMAAASDLWGYGVGRVLLMGLRRLTYGDLWGSHGCGLGPMGLWGWTCFTYGVAAFDLWGSMG